MQVYRLPDESNAFVFGSIPLFEKLANPSISDLAGQGFATAQRFQTGERPRSGVVHDHEQCSRDLERTLTGLTSPKRTEVAVSIA